jgi:LuxR family maltose regulon positive regulatory protein
MRQRPVATYVLPIIAVRLRLQLAAVCHALGEPATAHHLLREVDDILRRRPALGTLVDEAEGLRARLSAAPAAPLSASPLTHAELRVLPYLQTHLTFAQIAERLYISRNTVATHVHAIYRKLAVSSRDDAVRCASAAGVLGG